MRRHLIALLGIVALACALQSIGCRDYDLLGRGDFSASVDLAGADLGADDLAGGDASAMDGGNGDAATSDSAMCPAGPSPAAFDFGFPPIAVEADTGFAASANKPKQVVVGHFVNATELDVVTLSPGAAGVAELHFLKAGGATNLQYVTGGIMPFCASQIAAGHIDGSNPPLDRLVIACDCGVYSTEACAVHSYSWTSAVLPTPGAPVLTDSIDLGTTRPLAIALARLGAADPRDSLVLAAKSGGVGAVAAYASGPAGKFQTATAQTSPALPFSDSSAVVVGSFNPSVDATLDIAVLSAAGSSPVLAIVTRGATGTMSIASGVTPLPSINITGMAAGDLDQDGHPDLFFTTVTSDSAIVFAQNGTSSLFTQATVAMGGLSFAPVIVDWNRDGALDVFFWRQGDGGGTNLTAVHPRLLWNHGTLMFESIAVPAPFDLTSVAVNPGYLLSPQAVAADTDGDCAPELVFVSGQSTQASLFRR